MRTARKKTEMVKAYQWFYLTYPLYGGIECPAISIGDGLKPTGTRGAAASRRF